jgi:hypothetical protein
MCDAYGSSTPYKNERIDNLPILDQSMKFELRSLESTICTIEEFQHANSGAHANPWQFLDPAFADGVDDRLLAVLSAAS